jgi:hypothetical protein
MPWRPVLLWLALASAAIPARGLAAQTHAPVSIEASVGFREGHGGTYVNRGGGALDLALAYRLGAGAAGALVGALIVGAQTQLVALDLCLLLPDGGCAPDFPTVASAGALLGVQRGSARTGSVRVLAGPVVYLAGGGGGAAGFQGRGDLATPSWHRAALVASLRHSSLPRFRGEAIGITAAGLGIRFH